MTDAAKDFLGNVAEPVDLSLCDSSRQGTPEVARPRVGVQRGQQFSLAIRTGHLSVSR